MPLIIDEIRNIASLQDLIDYYKANLMNPANWIFRGQSSSCWNLTTSLERIIRQVHGNLDKALNIEIAMIRYFQRHAITYINNPPDKCNIPNWLALMQHHGTPTRFFDWTHSFYVGLFFAVLDQTKGNTSALWAINYSELHDILPKKIINVFDNDTNIERYKNYEEIQKHGKGIVKINASFLNPRLTIQQGTFLFPLDPTSTFEANLEKLQESAHKVYKDISIKKIIMKYDLRNDIFNELFRMNISNATLFPGIDGFASVSLL